MNFIIGFQSASDFKRSRKSSVAMKREARGKPHTTYTGSSTHDDVSTRQAVSALGRTFVFLDYTQAERVTSL